MRKLIPERDAASFLGCSTHKLQKDRRSGSPIPYKKIGRSVRYDVSDLESYLNSQTFTSTTQYGG